MIKTETVTTEAIVDDLTGREITRGGWELNGIGRTPGEARHYQSLTGLIAAILTKPQQFRLTDRGYVAGRLSEYGIDVRLP